MPQYVFLCQDCKKEFTQILHIAEMEKGGVVCPQCGGNRVTHPPSPATPPCVRVRTRRFESVALTLLEQ